MKKIIVVVESAEDGFFSAFSKNVDGLFGAGETVEEARESIMESIEISKELNTAPEILNDDYTIEWLYDIKSLLRYWKIYMTFAGMEKFTGISAKQLEHYASGLKKPRKQQRERIVDGFAKVGEQLHKAQLA